MRTPLVAILLASLVAAGQSSPSVPLHMVDAGMLAATPDMHLFAVNGQAVVFA